jgi:phage-related baseplate assembly protein
MALIFSALLRATTPDEQITALLGALKAKRFPVTAWGAFSVGRTLVEISAQVLSNLSTTAVNVVRGGFLSLAENTWLDWLAEEFYGLKRKPASFCERMVTVTVDGSAAALTKGLGELIIADVSGAYRFRNNEAINILPGDSADVLFRAELPGIEPNAVEPIIPTVAIPGVTLEVPEDGGIEVFGNDRENDESLRSRCRDALPLQGTGATEAAYRSWALSVSSDANEIRRVQVLPAVGDGTVDIYIASGSGPASVDAVAAAQAYIEEQEPLTVLATVHAAAAVDVTITANLVGPESRRTAALDEAHTNLVRLFSELPIGTEGTVYRSAIIEQLMLPTGVVNAVLTLPATDVAVADGQVAKLNGTPTLTYNGT